MPSDSADHGTIRRRLRLGLDRLAETGRALRTVRRLAALAKGHLWFLPLMTALALLSSAF